VKFLIEFWNKHKKVNLIILKLVLFGILAFNLYSKFSGEDFDQMLKLFKEEFSFTKIHYLLLVICLTFFNWGFETAKFYICVQRLEKISFWRAYRGILYGNAMNLILPMSLGELTGRPLVLKEENRYAGSGVAYYVSIVQKVASPFVGLLFLLISFFTDIIPDEKLVLFGYSIGLVFFIAALSILDMLFWLFMFLFPEWMLHILERIKSLKRVFLSIENLLHYKSAIKAKLLLIGSIRFLIFVTQYWLLMFLFFDNFPHFTFYILCGVYFLAQFVIPSMGFLDVGIRANLVAFIFSLYTQNFLQLMAVNYLIWVINLLIPSIFGFYLMRKSIISIEE
jgi:MFS family permease